MDTLSSSVSTLKVSALRSSPREVYHFKSPSNSYQFPWNTTAGPKSSLSNITTSQASHPKGGAFGSAQRFSTDNAKSLSVQSSPITHKNPASGYAAALIEITQNNGSLENVQKDVEKLLKLLLLLDETEKEQAVKEVVKRGKLNRFLVVLLKLLVERNKIAMVSEVLMEFERIYDQLSGTNVVWVSSTRKMKEDDLSGIARRVQKLNGASAFNVKIKNFVGERYPPL